VKSAEPWRDAQIGEMRETTARPVRVLETMEPRGTAFPIVSIARIEQAKEALPESEARFRQVAAGLPGLEKGGGQP